MFKWSETDLTEFFGVVATFHDDTDSHEFEVNRDGLRLLVTLFNLEGAVYVSIFRDGLPKPLFTVRMAQEDGASSPRQGSARRAPERRAPVHG